MPPTNSTTPQSESGDLHLGAFTTNGPWVIDPPSMPWRQGIDQRRRRVAEIVPGLVAKHALPGWRAVRVVWLLGLTVIPWLLLDRRRDRAGSAGALAARMRVTFEHLGPTYIKFAQLISSAEGILPTAVVEEFKRSQDRVPAEAFTDVRRIVETELGRPLEEVFSEFEETPIAAASIAQVHAATLVTGEQVVVKVQRPRIRQVIPADLRVMAWIARLLVGRLPSAALANPPAYVELFADTVAEELDFRLEAENMLDIARVLAETDQRRVVCPRPHPTLVTGRVLVMERLYGHRADDLETLRAVGVDPSEVLRALFVCFMEGAMVYGVFHGDMHGGNTLVTEDSRTILLDFGITGRLEDRERIALLRLMMNSLTNDYRSQLIAARDLGAFPPDVDVDGLLALLDIERLRARTASGTPADELAEELRELLTQLLAHGAKMPKTLMLFVKGMIYLTGAVSRIGGDLDIVKEMTYLVGYMTQTHGAALSEAVGFDMSALQFDMAAAIRDATGAEVTEGTTLRELQDMQAERQSELRRELGLGRGKRR